MVRRKGGGREWSEAREGGGNGVKQERGEGVVRSKGEGGREREW